MNKQVETIQYLVKAKFKNQESRYLHTLGVVKMALQLARIHGVNEEETVLAALLHDYCRYDTKETMLKLITDEKIIKEIADKDYLLHGYAAAYYLKNELKINNEKIHQAILNHTTGRINMSRLDEIIFISDFAEVTRNHKEAKEIRELAFKDFYQALYLTYFYQINYLEKTGKKASDLQKELMAYYLKKKEMKK
ncbi:MAG: bis(5'-nucleosyl)-tetraphosphatase (symmetrical) YqeK [Erysipelotrichales bacterium]|nr:bis(5'-nucleosyl)-tetraphosphatase (symmetrical) YqeK [Erysipelotrichales bacterium]